MYKRQVYEFPLDKKQDTGFLYLENLHLENHTLLNTNKVNTKKNIKKKNSNNNFPERNYSSDELNDLYDN